MGKRRRAAADETDPLDLLLDTVSNVFGGVMFLTLLAALMVISRGADSLDDVPPTDPSEQVTAPEESSDVDAALVQMQLDELTRALEIQSQVMASIEATPAELRALAASDDVQSQLDAVKAAIASAETTKKQLETQVRVSQTARDEQSRESDRIRQEYETTREELERVRAKASRTIEFRPMRASATLQAVVLLRYGRAYLFKTSPGQDFNRRDFFIVESEDSKTTITPKPHAGIVMTPDAAGSLARTMAGQFPPSRYNLAIAVWDDSFAEFNTLKDATTAAGFAYRTLTMNDASKLSFDFSGTSWVQ